MFRFECIYKSLNNIIIFDFFVKILICICILSMFRVIFNDYE